MKISDDDFVRQAFRLEPSAATLIEKQIGAAMLAEARTASRFCAEERAGEARQLGPPATHTAREAVWHVKTGPFTGKASK
jgi:hypothetical protein